LAKDKIAITEREFGTQVEDLLNLYRWLWCHFRPARTDKGWRTALSGYAGFPDYIALRDGVMLVFELKSDRGKVTEEQRQWLDGLKSCGQTVYVWRPADIEAIAEILR
jgi:hypothetical protein